MGGGPCHVWMGMKNCYLVVKEHCGRVGVGLGCPSFWAAGASVVEANISLSDGEELSRGFSGTLERRGGDTDGDWKGLASDARDGN